MSAGDVVFRSMGSLRHLVKLFDSIDEGSLRNRELFAEALRRLDNLAEYRRLRIFSGSNTICSTYFFGMPRSSVQYVMTAMLTFTPSLILFLIFVLNHPFIGANRVSDAPLKQVLRIMRELATAPTNPR